MKEIIINKNDIIKIYDIEIYYKDHIEVNKNLTTYLTLLLVYNNVVIILSYYTYIWDDYNISLRC